MIAHESRAPEQHRVLWRYLRSVAPGYPLAELTSVSDSTRCMPESVLRFTRRQRDWEAMKPTLGFTMSLIAQRGYQRLLALLLCF